MPQAAKKFRIDEWYDSLTPEQQKAHIEKIQRRRIEVKAEKEKERTNAIKQAQALLPELIAREVMAGDSTKEYRPSNETLHKLRVLISKGCGIQEMRQGPFRSLSDKHWQALTKFLFKDHYSQGEDLGLMMIKSRQVAVKDTKSRIGMLKRQIKWHKTEYPKLPCPIGLIEMLGREQKYLHEIEVEMAKTMHNINIVGEKAQSAGLTIIMNTPRPPKQQEMSIDITPKAE